MAARVTAFVVFAIVAVTLVAGLIVGAQRDDDSGPVDLIVYNAKVYTGVADAPFAEAIAVRGNRIIRVGSNREIKRLMRRATTVIDAHGGSVTAGFHDGNVDLKAAGLAIEHVPPPLPAEPASAEEAVDSLDAIRRAITEANGAGVTSVDVAARTPDDLLAYDTLLRTRELTARVTASLAAEWPLDEAAVARLDATRRRYEGIPFFKVAAVRLTVSDGLDDPPARAASAIPQVSAHGSDAAAAYRPATARTAHGSRTVAKAESAVAAATAIDPVAELSRSIALLESRGWQVILQTKDAGDADLALNALQAALPATSPAAPAGDRASEPKDDPKAAPDPKRRVRLELGTGVDAPTVARLTQLGVIASVQKPAAAEPTPLVARAEDEAAAAPAVQPWPYANLLAADAAPFIFHSGWPVVPLDPRFALSAVLVDGQAAEDGTADDATPADEERLSARLSRAIDAYTRHAAYASGNEDQQGTLAKAMLADFVIFSTDLFTLPPDRILEAEVAATIFDGKVVYTRPEPAPIPSTQ